MVTYRNPNDMLSRWSEADNEFILFNALELQSEDHKLAAGEFPNHHCHGCDSDFTPGQKNPLKFK